MGTAETVIACGYNLIAYLLEADEAFIVDWGILDRIDTIVLRGEMTSQKWGD